MNGPQYPAHEAALIDIETIQPVLSPVYKWGHASEDDLAPKYAALYVEAAGLTSRDLPDECRDQK